MTDFKTYWHAADQEMRSPFGQRALRAGWGAELFRSTLCFGPHYSSEQDTAEQLRFAAGVQKQFFHALENGPPHPRRDAVLAIGQAERRLAEQLRAAYLRRGRERG